MGLRLLLSFSELVLLLYLASLGAIIYSCQELRSQVGQLKVKAILGPRTNNGSFTLQYMISNEIIIA